MKHRWKLTLMLLCVWCYLYGSRTLYWVLYYNALDPLASLSGELRRSKEAALAPELMSRVLVVNSLSTTAFEGGGAGGDGVALINVMSDGRFVSAKHEDE